MQGYAKELEHFGHQVTSRWIRGEHEIHEGCDSAEFNRKFAAEDYVDLRIAHTMIAFTEEPSVKSRGRGGRHVELGLALAWGKRILLVGPRENVFHWRPEIEVFSTWGEAMEAAKGEHDGAE
jgi:hypothetical protein